jgi:hypothetical protein
MIEILQVLLGVVAALMVMFWPLGCAVAAWWIYRKKGCLPPVWTGVLLWTMALAGGTGLVMNPLENPWPLVVSAVAGILTCTVVGGAVFLGRWRGFTFRKPLWIAWVPGLVILLWADLRFCVVVRDQDGNLTRWTGPPTLTHRGRGWNSDEFEYGKKPFDGVIYIGLIRWLKWKDDWWLLREGKAEWSMWPWAATEHVHRPAK